MTNDPAPGGEQPGWQGQQPYPGGYGQPGQHGDQPAYPGAYAQPAGYGQQPPPPWAGQGRGGAWSGGQNPQGGPAGLGPGGAPAHAQAQSFSSALFDFGFNSFATPVVIKVLYILSLVGIGLLYVVSLISGFLQGPLNGLIALVVGGVLALAALIYTRVGLELIFAVVRIAEDVRLLRNRP